MEIICQAKAHLKKLGVNQWQSGYPDEVCIQNDIAQQKAYFLVENSNIVGYLCIDFDGEPSYTTLKGQWKSDQPFAVVHRLCISDSFKGKGLCAQAFALTEQLCLQKGIHSIKIDTDDANLSMKHILQKSGFVYCGTICFDNSEKIAFEKIF